MSLAPFEAQKRAQSFTQAEALAVTFAGKAEAEQSLPDIPAGCSVTDPIDSVYRIDCIAGSRRFQSKASRSFRIAKEIDDGGSGGRNFLFQLPRNTLDTNALKMTGGVSMAQTRKLLPANLKIFGPNKNTLHLIPTAGYMTPTTTMAGAIIQTTNKDLNTP